MFTNMQMYQSALIMDQYFDKCIDMHKNILCILQMKLIELGHYTATLTTWH